MNNPGIVPSHHPWKKRRRLDTIVRFSLNGAAVIDEASPMIYHITSRQHWSEFQSLSHYHDKSLQTEGFIHCSTRDQLVGSANLHFQGQSALVVLCIDELRLEVDLRYENLTGGSALFPHVYGPLNADAIVEVYDLPQASDGTFQLPSQLA